MSDKHMAATTSAPGGAAVKRGRGWLVAGALAALVVLVAGGVFLMRPKAPPRVNAPIEEIARYVDATSFKDLPFDRQAFYMKVLDERREDLRNALHNRVMGEEEYRSAVEYAWFGKQLARMEKCQVLRDTAERSAHLEKVARKNLEEKQQEGSAVASPDDPPKREKSFEKTYPLTWPAEMRLQWDQYRKEYKKAEKKVEREMIAASLQGPKTQPTGATAATKGKLGGKNKKK